MALTKEDLQAISELVSGLLVPVNERLDKVDAGLDKMETELDKMDARLDQVEVRLDQMDERFEKVEDKLHVIVFRQNHMSKKMEDLQLDLKVVKRDIEREIHDLNDQMETVIVILETNELLPKKKPS